MEEDKRLGNNLRYTREAIKIAEAAIKESKENDRQDLRLNTGTGIFTSATVEKYVGEER